MIWILTDDVWSTVATRVRAELETLGHPVLTLDPEVCRGLSVEVAGTELAVHIDDCELALPAAVLNLRDPIPYPTADSGLGADEIAFVAQQWQIMISGLVRALEAKHVPVLNPTGANLIDEKTAQLISAAECGFTTPPALHSARGAHAGAFVRRQGRRCVTKPFAPFMRMKTGGESVQRLLTNLTSSDALEQGMAAASVDSPTIVQPFVDAPFEHRVVVVGSQVFSARIARHGENAIDVRRLSPAKATVTACQLPDHIIDRCRQLVTRNDLYLAAIDLLETSTDDYVFLDLNPSGHFFWVEQLTGAPICKAIASLLDTVTANSRTLHGSTATVGACISS